ncbi:MAG: ABC transporter permease [Duodenibacillus sp.]|nr:ABC transporter permease [Duodenibacillus sp.]
MKDLWVPFEAILVKEAVRFLKIWKHALVAPVLTSCLYLVVFGEALDRYLPVYGGVGYTEFIIPGLIMMSVLQNAFANASSSIIQSKLNGSIVFMLMPAIPGWVIVAAYVCASCLRCGAIGLGLYAVCSFWARPPVTSPVLMLAFGAAGALIMSSAGVITFCPPG